METCRSSSSSSSPTWLERRSETTVRGMKNIPLIHPAKGEGGKRRKRKEKVFTFLLPSFLFFSLLPRRPSADSLRKGGRKDGTLIWVEWFSLLFSFSSFSRCSLFWRGRKGRSDGDSKKVCKVKQEGEREGRIYVNHKSEDIPVGRF